MNVSHPQLHLALEFRRDPTLAEYLSGPNAEAVAAVSAMARGEGEPYLFLFGIRGTGKTHLSQAACLTTAQRGRQAHFVPLGMTGLEPSVFDDLERLDLVAVDDAQCVAGDLVWESALFDLFNRLREQGRRLIVAANAAPDILPIKLPDLASRLLWGPRYCLMPLSDRDSEQLLIESAHRRGMRLGSDLVRYIMNYHARDPASLLDLIARLDSLSLREQRQPTIPLVRRAMRETS
ncbi:DnaA regulatory inactivator Hda [Thiocystis violacea]|uniref:DnaA regulatory inactivator Hda n=1 Tax=Thiocystis violacea TaxID=13725 RepID=UPI0019079883|nr:DnaA regulatory inactivator Hda [Thiocystis violacea]MBK1716804.1 DnaA regulatory inactivator Hda [Thiocystis violacea]